METFPNTVILSAPAAVDKFSFPLSDLSERTGLDIERFETSFYGVCPTCKNGE